MMTEQIKTIKPEYIAPVAEMMCVTACDVISASWTPPEEEWD